MTVPMKPQLSQHFISTAKAVFCVSFSPDGMHLAAGTGSYYAVGSQLLLFPMTGSAELCMFVGEPQIVSLSHLQHHPNNNELFKTAALSATALYFTPDGYQLWLATSSSYRGPGPFFCLDMLDKPLTLSEPLYIPLLRDAYPDGFAQSEGLLFICCHDMAGRSSDEVYRLTISSTNMHTSSTPKMLQLNGQLVTPRATTAKLEQGVRPNRFAPKFGLSIISVPTVDSNLAQMAKCAQITAPSVQSALSTTEAYLTTSLEHAIVCLAPRPGSQGFTTGNSQGALHHWWFDGHWRNRLLDPVEWPKPDTLLVVENSMVGINCVVAIQYMPNDEGWLTLHTNGLLIHWKDDEIRHYEQVSHVGTPRCMALHPSKPVLAIGIKHNTQLQGAGVMLIDLSNWITAINL